VAPTAAPSHPSPPSSATQAQLSPSAKPSEPPAWARPDAPAETPAAPPQARQVNEGADRNDRDAEEQLDGAELLSQRLGAQVIEEIPHN
jgi:hypothetical protein